NIYGTKFLIYLMVTQVLLKGCLFYGTFNQIIFPLLNYLDIDPYWSQLYYVVMYAPWTFKPLIGMILDTVIIYYYKKRFWQILTSLLSLFTVAIFVTIMIIPEYNWLVLLIVGFFILNTIIVTLDIISEATYSEIIISK